MNISGKTMLCIIIGDPVEHSLSPAMHNAAYEALGIDNAFVFTAAHVHVEDVKEVARAVRVLGVRGLTCTMPHKIEIMKYLDWIDPIAEKIGAVNTVVNQNGILKGYNTDWLGVVTPLEIHGSLKNKKVALLGAGGAARAACYGFVERGAKLTIFNRTIEKAEALSNEFGSTIQIGRDPSLIPEFDIIFNATTIGMGSYEGKSPIPKDAIQPHHIVFDAIYTPYDTQLLKYAQEQGARIIHGTEMLLHQGVAQFELYTGKKGPVEVMREVLEKTV